MLWCVGFLGFAIRDSSCVSFGGVLLFIELFVKFFVVVLEGGVLRK